MSGLFDNYSSWEYRLLGAIIRINVEDYNDPSRGYYDQAKRFLFDHAGEIDDQGRPRNKLEFWLSFTDVSPDAIRRHLKKPDD